MFDFRFMFFLLLAIGLTFGPYPVATSAGELPKNHPRRHVHGGAFNLQQLQVVQGNDEAAEAYYDNVVSPQTSLNFASPLQDSTIRQLLKYFGYEDLTAVQLHELSSDDLMALGSAGEILATRFFAPKISDVADRPQTVPAGGFGWRKLVVLTARAGSKARDNEIETLYILQNVFEKTVTGDPFDADRNFSNFNQAIIVRKTGTGPYNSGKQPLYFLTYGPFIEIQVAGNGIVRPLKIDGKFREQGKLILSLRATFDEDDRDPETNSQPKNYFVPDSCAQCHGASRRRLKLNYLDTDHWLDRVFPNYNLPESRFSQDDFTAISGSPFAVLYDAGKDPADPQFKKAFNVIRVINQKIATQNADVGGGNNFQLAAAEKWLNLHEPTAFGATHVPPAQRGFGATIWDANKENERKLVYYLNRYCYRCHSSLRFNVFDRSAVQRRADRIEARTTDISNPIRWMPQDRIFAGLVISQGVPSTENPLKEFLEHLQELE